MKIIDKNTWSRREAFEMFSQMEYPFYSVTIPIDITEVKKASDEERISFYYLMVWLCTKAVNSVEQFRIRTEDDDIVVLDVLKPSFTDMKKGAEQFHIVSLPWEENPVSFCEKAAAQSKNQVHFIESAESKNLIYFSCLPWFDFTSLTNEHKLDKDDFFPRIAWGKYYEEKGHLWVHMSIEVNHRMIDGIHLGQLKEAIDREIALLDLLLK